METSHPIMTHEDEIRMKKLNELIDNLLRMRTDSQAIVDFSQKHFELLEENESLKAINKQLMEASNELLKAIEQEYFFMEGYKNGSASISEVKDAQQKSHQAYSKLWNIVKQEGL